MLENCTSRVNPSMFTNVCKAEQLTMKLIILKVKMVMNVVKMIITQKIFPQSPHITTKYQPKASSEFNESIVFVLRLKGT